MLIEELFLEESWLWDRREWIRIDALGSSHLKLRPALTLPAQQKSNTSDGLPVNGITKTSSRRLALALPTRTLELCVLQSLRTVGSA